MAEKYGYSAAHDDDDDYGQDPVATLENLANPETRSMQDAVPDETRSMQHLARIADDGPIAIEFGIDGIRRRAPLLFDIRLEWPNHRKRHNRRQCHCECNYTGRIHSPLGY